MNQKIGLINPAIENAVIKICTLIESEKKEKIDWQSYSEDHLWHELVSCILGSRVLFETAKACAIHLRDSGLLDISSILKKPVSFEKKIMIELQKPIFPPYRKKGGCKYRFPETKSNCIVETAIDIYEKSNISIKSILKSHKNPHRIRDILVEKCHGIGPKQASLFLRNISFCDNLAIIDSHVSRYIGLLNLNEKGPQIIKNKKDYFYNERILSSYAKLKNMSLASLDLAIWVVMGVATKEF